MQDGTHVYVVGVVVEVYQLPLANLELGHEVVVAVLGHPLGSILQAAASLGAAHQVQDLFDVWVEGEQLVLPQGVELGKALQLNQVWSLIQFYSVDFSQSRIGVNKCVFYKRTIEVCVSCC